MHSQVCDYMLLTEYANLYYNIGKIGVPRSLQSLNIQSYELMYITPNKKQRFGEFRGHKAIKLIKSIIYACAMLMRDAH